MYRQVLQPGGKGAARVERLTMQPHLEYLAQHVKTELEVSCAESGNPEMVNVRLGTGWGVTSISEELQW